MTSEDNDNAVSWALKDGVDDVKLPWQPPHARDCYWLSLLEISARAH